MKSKKQISYIWLGPIITLFLMMALFAVQGIYPFGNMTTAFSDGVSQYVPFLAEFANKIREGGSMLFTWHTGGGVNFWANFGYYLASPFNLISLLFKIDEMDKAFALITLIKPFFMALTFGIFLKYTYKKNDLSIVIFSILWAFSGFVVGSIFILSWSDAFIYFPLVIMSLKKLMDGQSAWMYALFLGLTIMANFYMGWMTCIFCVIYFIYSFISDDDVYYEGNSTSTQENDDESTINVFEIFAQSYILKTMFKFGLSSLLAGAFSAIFTLPTIFALQNTEKGQISHDVFNISDIWGLLAAHVFPAENEYASFVSMNYIFAFCGIATTILVIAYFFAKGISVRKKIGNAFLLAVMWASIVLYVPYYVWHGFGEPAGLMYRFAFIYSFVLLKIAFEAFIEIKNIKWYGILAGIIFAGVCTAGLQLNQLMRIYCSVDSTIIIKVIAFIIIFAVILLIMSIKPKLKNVMTIVLMVAVIAETLIMNTGTFNVTVAGENFAEQTVVESAIEEMEDYDKLTFASQKQTFQDMIMYGMVYGYNGLEYYSSMADGDVSLTITSLGTYGNNLNMQDGAQEQTPIFNILFPTKYYLDGTGRLSENSFRTKIKDIDDYVLYENNYTMPFMYVVSTEIAHWDPFSFGVCVDDQNFMAKCLTDIDENIISYNLTSNYKYENCKHISLVETLRKECEEKGIDFPETNIEYYEYLESKMIDFSFDVDDLSKDASVTFDSTAETDGIMYIFVDTSEFADMQITLNGKTTDYSVYGYGENRVYELGDVKKGDVATITIGGRKGDNDYASKTSNLSATTFTVDMEKFENAYNKLDAMSDTEMLEFSDTYVKAKVTSYTDGAIYIPTTYDNGWTLYIDGVDQSPLYEHRGHIIMHGLGEGEHIVEMKYCPVGFVPGAIITGASVVILVAWAIIATKRFKKEEEYATISSNDVNEE